MSKRESKSLIGMVFERLTVLSKAMKNKESKPMWNCICSCGNHKTILERSLLKGFTKSCGCLKSEKSKQNSTTHGLSKTIEYRIYQGIKRRCYNKNEKSYNRYGGRGIFMSDEWFNSFENFLLDMGIRPSIYHSIERRKNNLGYSKENCYWATNKEQCRNRASNLIITFNNKTQCAKDWDLEIFPGSKGLISRRLISGWSIEKTMTTPAKKIQQHNIN